MEIFTIASFVSKKISLRTRVWGRRELGLLEASRPGELQVFSFKGLLAGSLVLQAAGAVHLAPQDCCVVRGVVERVAGPDAREVVNFAAAVCGEKCGDASSELKITGHDAEINLLLDPRIQTIRWKLRILHPLMLLPPSNSRVTFEATRTYFRFTEEDLSQDRPKISRTDCLGSDLKSHYVRIETDPGTLLSKFANIYSAGFPRYSPSDPENTELAPFGLLCEIVQSDFSKVRICLEKGIELEVMVQFFATWHEYLIRLLIDFCSLFPEKLSRQVEVLRDVDQQIIETVRNAKARLEESKSSGIEIPREEFVEIFEDLLGVVSAALAQCMSSEFTTIAYKSFEDAFPNFIQRPDQATWQSWIDASFPNTFCCEVIQGHLCSTTAPASREVYFKNVSIESVLAPRHTAQWTGASDEQLDAPMDQSLLRLSTDLLAPLQKDAKFESAAVRSVLPAATEADMSFSDFLIPELTEEYSRSSLTIFKTTHQAIYVERVVNPQMIMAGRYFILRAPIANLSEVELVAETPSGGRFDLASEVGLDVLIAADSILHFHRTHRRTKELIAKGTIKLWDFIQEYLDRIKLGWDIKEFNEAYRLTRIVLRGVEYDEVSVCIGVCQGYIFLHIFSSSPDSDYNIHLFCQMQPTSTGSLRVLRLIEQKHPTNRDDSDAPGGIGGHGLYTITFSARKTYFYVVESYIYSGNNQFLYYFKPGKSSYPGKLRLPNEFRALNSGWRIFPYLSSAGSKKTRLLAYRTQGRQLDFKPRTEEERKSQQENKFWFEEEDTTPTILPSFYSQPRIQSFLLVVLEFS